MPLNKKIYIGIDNGVTGSIGLIHPNGEYAFFKTPVKMQQDYTKKQKNLSRIEVHGLIEILTHFKGPKKAVLERPLVNPKMFTATISAVRCFESTLCILEGLSIPFEFLDSKEWQKKLLPAGCKGAALKSASVDIATRLFPEYETDFKKQKDGDGMLIAEYARRSNL